MLIKLEQIPLSGEYEEISFDIEGPYKSDEWDYVLFTKHNGEQWCGFFRKGDYRNFIVAEIEDQNLSCIISGGHGYIIDVENKKKIQDIDLGLIIDLVVDKQNKIFYIATRTTIYYFDQQLELHEIDLPFFADEIQFKGIRERKLGLQVMEIGADMVIHNEYFLDLDKKTIIKQVSLWGLIMNKILWYRKNKK